MRTLCKQGNYSLVVYNDVLFCVEYNSASVGMTLCSSQNFGTALRAFNKHIEDSVFWKIKEVSHNDD